MIITYTPDEGSPEEYDFNPGKLMSPEAEAIESVGDYAWDSFETFGAMFFKGNVRARRAALWIMKKRKNPRLKFDEVSFRANQVDVDYSPAERKLLLEAMLQDPDLDPEQKANITQELGEETSVAYLEEKLGEAGVNQVPVPKEQSEFSGNVGRTLPREDLPRDSGS
jgi:hypothetical protein